MSHRLLGLTRNCIGAVILLVLALPLAGADSQGRNATTLITIGSGGVHGVYYPAAGALCRLLNRRTNEHNIQCLAETSNGSVQNVSDLRAGIIDFGLVQTDIQSDAIHGNGRFSSDGKAASLRSLFTVHPEPFTIVARLDSGIRHFTDLKAKRVNLDGIGSGSRATMELVLQAFGMTERDLTKVFSMPVASAQEALCENKIDAFVFVVGHPNRAVRDVAESCAVRLVEVGGEPVEKLLREYKYFSPTTIQGGVYSGNQTAVQTFGVRAGVLTHSGIDDEVAYQLTRAAFENLNDLRRLHPAFAQLQASDMMVGNTAPLHKGAQRYFDQTRAR